MGSEPVGFFDVFFFKKKVGVLVLLMLLLVFLVRFHSRSLVCGMCLMVFLGFSWFLIAVLTVVLNAILIASSGF